MITDCAREPIHIPGSIQPHGLLLTVLEPDFPIQQVSQARTDWLGASPEAVLQQPLARIAPQLAAALLPGARTRALHPSDALGSICHKAVSMNR